VTYPTPDLIPNLALFVAGVLVATACLRTGLVVRGVLLMVLVWVLADGALLVRYVWEDRTDLFLGTLAAMQVVCAWSVVWWIWARVRRRLGRMGRQRNAVFAEGQASFLRGDLEAARRTFARMLGHDPWDAATAIAMAEVLQAQGRRSAARGWLKQARNLDLRKDYHDLISARLASVG
jgi:tetratricopeptide (TPR) repeat protein